MKEFKIFMYILVSFFFASCGEIYVNMDNMEYSVDKNVCKENEPIEINFKGHFYPQDEVLGVWIEISLYKNNNENNESCEMNIISRNNAPIDWTDRKFHYCFQMVEKSFFCYFLEEKNMTNWRFFELGTFFAVIEAKFKTIKYGNNKIKIRKP